MSLAGGPEGWALTPTADGFELGGTPLAPGVDVEYSVTVAQLPADSTDLAFPTLQRYSDGHEDAWIEPVTDALPAPERPAPVLTVARAQPGATAETSGPTAGETAPTETTASTDVQTGEASDSTRDGSKTGTIILVIGLLSAVVIAAGAWAWRARRRA